MNTFTTAKMALVSGVLGLMILTGCGDKPEAQPTAQSTAEPIEATTEAVNKSDNEAQTSETMTGQRDSLQGELEQVDGSESIQSQRLDTPDTQADLALTDVAKTDVAEENATAVKDDAPLAAGAGKALYEQKCQVCHGSGLLESPKTGDKEAWSPRIAKGIDVLHKHSAQGFGKMPAQADGDVSEAQVYAAVDYIVEQSS